MTMTMTMTQIYSIVDDCCWQRNEHAEQMPEWCCIKFRFVLEKSETIIETMMTSLDNYVSHRTNWPHVVCQLVQFFPSRLLWSRWRWRWWWLTSLWLSQAKKQSTVHNKVSTHFEYFLLYYPRSTQYHQLNYPPQKKLFHSIYLYIFARSIYVCIFTSVCVAYFRQTEFRTRSMTTMIIIKCGDRPKKCLAISFVVLAASASSAVAYRFALQIGHLCVCLTWVIFFSTLCLLSLHLMASHFAHSTANDTLADSLSLSLLFSYYNLISKDTAKKGKGKEVHQITSCIYKLEPEGDAQEKKHFTHIDWTHP